jgi:WD40 repeat protein
MNINMNSLNENIIKIIYMNIDNSILKRNMILQNEHLLVSLLRALYDNNRIPSLKKIIKINNQIPCSTVEDNSKGLLCGTTDRSIIHIDNKFNIKTIDLGHTNRIQQILVLDGVDKFITVSWDTTIRLYNKGGTRTFGWHWGEVTSVIQLRNKLILTGSSDSIIKVWDPNTFGNRQAFSSQSYISKLLQLNDGRIVVCNSKNGCIKVYRENYSLEFGFCPCDSPMNTLIQLKDNRVLIGYSNSTIVVWDGYYWM